MVHEPWQMQVLRLTLCPDYPLPLVDHKTASKQAKDEIFGRRKLAVARAEAQGVYLRHGSRSGPRRRQISRKRPTHPKVEAPQLLLDLN
jgi:deoxyribodipyrimidine photo-lyase